MTECKECLDLDEVCFDCAEPKSEKDALIEEFEREYPGQSFWVDNE